MQKTLKECNICNKFYDIRNINFCLNIAISEKLDSKIKENQKKYLLNLNNLMTDATAIKWCTCNTEEKKSYLEEAIRCLEDVNQQDKSLKEENLGFDFKLNEDIMYVANEHNFVSSLFLKFIKSLKSRLKEDNILSFDFIDFDKLTQRDFDPKNYYSKQNYLLIYDFENLQEDNIDIIIKLNNIIKQRKSNNKKTFIMSNIKIEKLQNFLITRFYTKDEHIVLEFYNLLKNSFLHKTITTIEQKNDVKINTSDTKNRKKRATTKKKDSAETKDSAEKNELFL